MELILIFIALILIMRIFFESVSPEFKGKRGEIAVSNILSTLPQTDYKIVNDLMIKTEFGTTQIDHVVISLYGIFVIETKNYKGWITGSEESDYWFKNMYGKKYRFYNPLKQNYGHVIALSNILNIDRSIFIPIVAFTSKSSINVQTDKHLIQLFDIKNTVKSYSTKVLANSEVENLYSKLVSLNIISSESKKAHISSITNNTKDLKTKIRSGICPKCGSALVLRNGRYGQFYGCSSYPKCKYTYNISS